MAYVGKGSTTYIDTCLPFSLHSAPFLFNQLSMAIRWTLQHKYHVCYLLHYLDNFFVARLPASDECSYNIAYHSLCVARVCSNKDVHNTGNEWCCAHCTCLLTAHYGLLAFWCNAPHGSLYFLGLLQCCSLLIVCSLGPLQSCSLPIKGRLWLL